MFKLLAIIFRKPLANLAQSKVDALKGKSLAEIMADAELSATAKNIAGYNKVIKAGK